MRQGVRIGVDVGKARVGVARCDAEAIMAVPVASLDRDRYGADLDEVADLVTELGAMEVVVGLPLHLSGQDSASTADARGWARALAGRVRPVPVRLVDERLSTVSAHRALRDSGLQAKAFRPVVDQAAAVVILDQALEVERSTGAPAGALVPARQRGRR